MKMKWWSWIFIGAGAIASLIVYPDMPDQLPVHWNFEGEADRFASKSVALFLIPAILAAMTLIIEIRLKTDKGNKNAAVNRPNVNIIRNIVVLALMIVHAYTIYYGYGYELSISRLMSVVLGIVFIVTGNYMPRIRTNRFAGIRTPLTLTNEDAWRKANTLGGRLLVLGGALMLITAVLPSSIQAYGLLTALVLTIAAQFYALYKASRHRKAA